MNSNGNSMASNPKADGKIAAADDPSQQMFDSRWKLNVKRERSRKAKHCLLCQSGNKYKKLSRHFAQLHKNKNIPADDVHKLGRPCKARCLRCEYLPMRARFANDSVWKYQLKMATKTIPMICLQLGTSKSIAELMDHVDIVIQTRDQDDSNEVLDSDIDSSFSGDSTPLQQQDVADAMSVAMSLPQPAAVSPFMMTPASTAMTRSAAVATSQALFDKKARIAQQSSMAAPPMPALKTDLLHDIFARVSAAQPTNAEKANNLVHGKIQTANQNSELQHVTKQFYVEQQDGQEEQKEVLKSHDNLISEKNKELEKGFEDIEREKAIYFDKLHHNEVFVEQIMQRSEEHETKMNILRRQAKERLLLLRQKHAEELEQLKKYKDVGNWKERFTVMGMIAPQGGQLEEAEKLVRETSDKMKEIGVAVNNNQLAIAFAATSQLNKQVPQQIFSVPAGHGKSRIIPAIVRMIAAINSAKGVPSFIIVYNDEVLLENDRPIIEQAVAGVNVDLQFKVTSANKHVVVKNKESVVIIDEVDDVLVDQTFKLAAAWPKGTLAQVKVIGLTATTRNLLMQQEIDFLQDDPYRFQMYESKIHSVQDDYLYGNIDEFFSDKFQGMARLIYIDGTGDKLCLISNFARANNLTILKDKSDLAVLRSLTSKHVVVVTQKHLMRGYDYHCETGIVLLICKQMDSKKSLLQALGRVGRYGNKCVRMVGNEFQNNPDGPIDKVRGNVAILNAITNIKRRVATGNGTSLDDFFGGKK